MSLDVGGRLGRARNVVLAVVPQSGKGNAAKHRERNVTVGETCTWTE